MGSYPCCTFLMRASEYCEDPRQGLHAESIAHYLMGIVDEKGLPEKLQKYAGDWLTPAMKKELKYLLYTHRFVFVESHVKTQAKLRFILDKSLTRCKALPGLLVADDFVQMQRSNWWCCAADDYREDVTRVFVSRYVRNPSEFDESFRQALHECLADQKFGHVGHWLRMLFQEEPERAKDPCFAELLGLWVGSMGQRTQASLEDGDLNEWIQLLFPVQHESDAENHAAIDFQPLRDALLQGLPHMRSCVLSDSLSGDRGSELKQAVMASVPHWSLGVDVSLAALRKIWHRIDRADRLELLQSMAGLVAKGQVKDQENLQFLVMAFDSGFIRAEHVPFGLHFFMELFDSAEFSFLNFLVHNAAYFVHEGDRDKLIHLLSQSCVLRPPTASELRREVSKDFLTALSGKNVEIDKSVLDLFVKTLEHKTYEVPIKAMIARHVEDVFAGHSIPADTSLQSEIVNALYQHNSSGVVSKRGAQADAKTLLLDKTSLSPEACVDAASALSQKNGGIAMEEWFASAFHVSPPSKAEAVFEVFRSFIGWETRAKGHLGVAMEATCNALVQADDAMHALGEPTVFASYVLMTLPYRSVQQLEAVLSREGLSKELKGVLRDACVTLQGNQEPGDPTGLMFAGYAEPNGVRRTAQFLKFADLSLLDPRSINAFNLDQICLRSDQNDRPVSKDDLPQLMLPTRFWNALSHHLAPPSLIGDHIQQLLVSLVKSTGQTLAGDQAELLKGAVQKAVSPEQNFSSSVNTKIALRTAMGDELLDKVLASLSEQTQNVDRANLHKVFLARAGEIPSVGWVDEKVKAFCEASQAEIDSAYYVFGYLLARLSSSTGLGWEVDVDSTYVQIQGVSDNQAVVGLRLLSAYCLCQCRDTLQVQFMGSAEVLDRVIDLLIRSGLCSNTLADTLVLKSVEPVLNAMSQSATALLSIKSPELKLTRAPEWSAIESGSVSASLMVIENGPSALSLIEFVRAQSRLPAIP